MRYSLERDRSIRKSRKEKMKEKRALEKKTEECSCQCNCKEEPKEEPQGNILTVTQQQYAVCEYNNETKNINIVALNQDLGYIKGSYDVMLNLMGMKTISIYKVNSTHTLSPLDE